PSYETVVSWVNASWNAVDIGLIQRAFKICDDSEIIKEIDLNDNTEDNYYNEQEMNYPNVWDD
ncbi:3736_t:CDS:2, partial [Ambispora leptoticha]